MKTDLEQIADAIDDPIVKMLLLGEAATLREAEEIYLDSSMPEVIRLLQSDFSNEELGAHPLMKMLRSHGSRGWEEAID